MRIIPDCIRDLLIDIEDTTTFNKHYIFSRDSASNLLTKYSYDEIIYHARYCYDGKLLTSFDEASNDYFIIADLSYEGHTFLENIRNNTNWTKVKKVLINAGSFSAKLMIEIAAQIAAAGVTSSLGF